MEHKVESAPCSSSLLQPKGICEDGEAKNQPSWLSDLGQVGWHLREPQVGFYRFIDTSSILLHPWSTEIMCIVSQYPSFLYLFSVWMEETKYAQLED